MSAVAPAPAAQKLNSVEGLQAALNRAYRETPWERQPAAAKDFFAQHKGALDTDVLIGASSKVHHTFRTEGEKEILGRELTASQLKAVVAEGQFSRDTRVAAATRLVEGFAETKESKEAADSIIGKVARAYGTDDIEAETRILRAMASDKYVQQRLVGIASGYATEGTIRGACAAGYILGYGISTGTRESCRKVLSATLENEQGRRLMVRGLVEQHAKGNSAASDLLLETAQRSTSAAARAEVVGHVGLQTGKPISTPEVLKPELNRFDRTILDIGLRDKAEQVTAAAVYAVEKNLGKGSEGLTFALAKVTDRQLQDATRIALLLKVEEYAAKTGCTPVERREVIATAKVLVNDKALKSEAERLLETL
jgi:hypothetical protein